MERLKSITIKKYRPHSTTKVYEQGENLLNRDFTTTGKNQKWVSDITYIHTLKDGWCYLASVLNLHTKKIVGYSFSTSLEYRNAVEHLEFKLSYSAKGCPYDNACIESFHAVLKKECVYLKIFLDYNQANLDLFKYIEGFYNRKRKHSAINYMSPDEYERLCSVA